MQVLQYQSKSYYIIGQEVYYSIGHFITLPGTYYIIGHFFITFSGTYYSIGRLLHYRLVQPSVFVLGGPSHPGVRRRTEQQRLAVAGAVGHGAGTDGDTGYVG